MLPMEKPFGCIENQSIGFYDNKVKEIDIKPVMPNMWFEYPCGLYRINRLPNS